MRVKVIADGAGWGEYVREGATYEVTAPSNKRNKTRGDYHFRNVATGGATFMRWYQFDRALAAGWLEVVAEDAAPEAPAFRCTPASILAEHDREVFSILASAGAGRV